MGIKVTAWDDGLAKSEVQKKFKSAVSARKLLENRWIRNERIIYTTTNGLNSSTIQNSLENSYLVGLPAIDGSDADMSVAYVFKNFRFIHAQMSANPPSVAMRPATSDADDHRRADAADRVVRWAIRHYSMQEKVDQWSLHTLLYGTGVLKTIWDSTKGDILEFDEESGEAKLEGDIDVSIPFIWNIFLDPDAKAMDELKWVFERIYIDYDEACARWPDKKDILKKALINENNTRDNAAFSGRNSELIDRHYNSVELLEYWETGLPTNGYLGRYCITTMEGEVVESCRPSPFRFKQAGAVRKIEESDLPDEVKEARIAKLPEKARLPYHILTDIDIPNAVWGRSFVEYAAQLQDNLGRIDTAFVDAIQAHGVVRMVLPEAAEISEDQSITNSNWDVLRISGNQPPYFANPPQLMGEMTSTRQNLINGINDVSGVNESMFGQQSREQSGASMQYATNQGNMIRRRLFNKYVLGVESTYKAILDLVRKHWTISRTIQVIGKEKALESIDLKGADIDGGYDVVGGYGVTLSLDPITRREEILSLQPLFKEAGISPRKMLGMMKLNELEGSFDALEKAGDRQKEIFDLMIATQSYIPPKKYRDHENMIAWALDYFMTSEFTMLDEATQALLERHIEERGQIAAMEKSGGAMPPATSAQLSPGPLPGAPAGEVPAPVGAPIPPTAG